MTVTHIDVDLDTIEVIVTASDVEVEVGVADMPGIEVGVPGPSGPPGPPGLVKVTHGSDPDVARPDVPLVYWVGTVLPNNGLPDDLLMLKAI